MHLEFSGNRIGKSARLSRNDFYNVNECYMLLLAQDNFTEIGGMTATGFTVTETNHSIKNVSSVPFF